MKKKILTIVGARPQFIKSLMVSKELVSRKIEEIIVHTGQHFDENMSAIFFKELKLKKPKYYLNINQGSHGQNTGRMIEEIEKILLVEKPRLVILYGDTNSTLAGAIASSKLKIKVAHIEAGLRSNNKEMPEEINRILTDHVSSLLFTTSQEPFKNLIKEGVKKSIIFNVGDVMFDSYKFFLKNKSIVNAQIKIKNTKFKSKTFNLLTIHREDTVTNRHSLISIFRALSFSPIPIIFPCHPRTLNMIRSFKINVPKNIYIIEPVGYIEMIKLTYNASKILTDSGGLQKEAYFCNVPCITLRNETEWKELIKLRVNFLTGSDEKKIIEQLLKNFTIKKITGNIYGSGSSSKKIIDIISTFLS